MSDPIQLLVAALRSAVVKLVTERDGWITRAELVTLLLKPGPNQCNAAEAEAVVSAIFRKFNVEGHEALEIGILLAGPTVDAKPVPQGEEAYATEPPAQHQEIERLHATIEELRAENEALHRKCLGVDRLRAENELLRGGNLETERLRAEIELLRGGSTGFPKELLTDAVEAARKYVDAQKEKRAKGSDVTDDWSTRGWVRSLDFADIFSDALVAPLKERLPSGESDMEWASQLAYLRHLGKYGDAPAFRQLLASAMHRACSVIQGGRAGQSGAPIPPAPRSRGVERASRATQACHGGY